jgi:transcriptional regulator with XRE-family HTH domain
MSEAGVGERLRSIRRQKGLSLHDVEARSRTEFKASVLGAYERGERAISVPRLMRLAEVYDVPPDTLLPRESEVEIDLTEAEAAQNGFTIDLTQLADIEDPEAAVLARYAATIQLQRQDFNGRMPEDRGPAAAPRAARPPGQRLSAHPAPRRSTLRTT